MLSSFSAAISGSVSVRWGNAGPSSGGPSLKSAGVRSAHGHAHRHGPGLWLALDQDAPVAVGLVDVGRDRPPLSKSWSRSASFQNADRASASGPGRASSDEGVDDDGLVDAAGMDREDRVRRVGDPAVM